MRRCAAPPTGRSGTLRPDPASSGQGGHSPEELPCDTVLETSADLAVAPALGSGTCLSVRASRDDGSGQTDGSAAMLARGGLSTTSRQCKAPTWQEVLRLNSRRSSSRYCSDSARLAAHSVQPAESASIGDRWNPCSMHSWSSSDQTSSSSCHRHGGDPDLVRIDPAGSRIVEDVLRRGEGLIALRPRPVPRPRDLTGRYPLCCPAGCQDLS